MTENPFVGTWTYRSALNEPDLAIGFEQLAFARGTLVIDDSADHLLKGMIAGPGWSLTLHGSGSYGHPMQVRFQGTGQIGGEDWAYDYIGWLVPTWPNSSIELQRDAIVGSVVRTLPHSGGAAVAGFSASFYAVR